MMKAVSQADDDVETTVGELKAARVDVKRPARKPWRRSVHARYGEQIGTGLLILWVAALIPTRYVPLIRGYPVAMSQAAILVFFTVCSWALGLLKEPVTTLLFFLFAMLFSVEPAQTVFAGFSSPAWWLVFGGAITGVAVRVTGLAGRFSNFLLAARIDTYGHHVAAVALGAIALAFVMLSTTGRVLLLKRIFASQHTDGSNHAHGAWRRQDGARAW
ncbi:MAG: anion permease [Pseudomonadota bacterium]|uniref:anion permease n=1 Tax=Paraburkholderia TaxID=1822464 RepID=UPI00048674AF|nr:MULTISPECIES: anion permease [Paraburkholderia]USU14538.1 anion permease [Paraburkholderia fungorum]USU22486.1 anion permease [Paraburkholderia fungorum]